MANQIPDSQDAQTEKLRAAIIKAFEGSNIDDGSRVAFDAVVNNVLTEIQKVLGADNGS